MHLKKELRGNGYPSDNDNEFLLLADRFMILQGGSLNLPAFEYLFGVRFFKNALARGIPFFFFFLSLGAVRDLMDGVDVRSTIWTFNLHPRQGKKKKSGTPR